MKHLAVATLAIMALSQLLFGCKGDTGPAGPSGGFLTGSLMGQVYVYDEDSSTYPLPDMSGVTVSVGNAVQSAITDRQGWWILNGLTTGTYTLTFAKPGYGTYKQFGFQFVGGDTAYWGSAYMGNVARHWVDSIEASVPGSYVLISGTLAPGHPPTLHPRYVVIFYDTSAMVSAVRYVGVRNAYVSSSDSTFQEGIDTNYLQSLGIGTGTQLYIVAYGLGGNYSNYFDPSKRQYVYPTASPTPSNVASVVMP